MKDVVALGAVLALGAGAVLLLRRKPDDGSLGFGGGADAGFGYGSVDPYSGLPIDPTTGLPQGPLAPVVGLSPAAERTIIEDNRRANDQLAQDSRDSLARTEANTRTANAFQSAAVVASTVPFALYGIGKYGPPLGASLQRGINAFTRAASSVVPRLSAPGASIAEFSALTPAGAAVGIGAGAALGLGAVKALDATGALDAVANASHALAQRAPAVVQDVVQSLALSPLHYVGAVATGAVGHGTVAGNLRQAVRDSERALVSTARLVRRWF